MVGQAGATRDPSNLRDGGLLRHPWGDFSASGSAFQFHLAESDPFVSPGTIVTQERQLRLSGRPTELHQYPGTGHWFFEWDRPEAYDEAAARLAWDRTTEFLDHHLPG